MTNMKTRTLIFFVLLFSHQLFAQNVLAIHPELGKEKINRHIYGHFAEHLGHCIYGGFYVAKATPGYRILRVFETMSSKR